MKHKDHITPATLYYPLVFALFFIDLCFFAWLEKPLVHTLLCFYIIQLLKTPRSFTQIATTLMLLSLSSLIFYGHCGITLIYLMPMTLICLYMRTGLYPASWYAHAVLIGALLAQRVLIEQVILHLKTGLLYTFLLLFANLIVISVFSLKKVSSYYFLGNRSSW